MKKILNLVLLICSINSFGQGVLVPGLGTRPIDTAYIARSLRVDSTVRLPKYASADTTIVFGIDSFGLLTARHTTPPSSLISGNRYAIPVFTSSVAIGSSSANDSPSLHKFTVADTLALLGIPNGHTGIDSFLVWGNISKEVKKISPVIYPANGGTGISTYSVAGSIPISGNGTVTMTYLPPGTSGQFITISSITGLPIYSTLTYVGAVYASDSTVIVTPNTGNVTVAVNRYHSDTLYKPWSYGGNYAALYNPRSITDKNYVDSNILAHVTGTPTITVSTANGISGSATTGMTPVITLSTTLTGIVKGASGAFAAATAGTDYVAPSALVAYTTTTSATTAQTVGNASVTPTITTDAQGRVTNITSNAIAIAIAQVTGLSSAIAAAIPTVTAASPKGTLNVTSTVSGINTAYGLDINTARADTFSGTQTFSVVSMNGQLAWNTGDGAITQIKGPTDQPFVIMSGVGTGTASVTGQALNISGAPAVAGTSTVTGAVAGAVNINGGSGAASISFVGAPVNITGGVGGSQSTSGAVVISTPNNTSGTTGSISLTTGNGSGGSNIGNITLTTGSSVSSIGGAAANIIGTTGSGSNNSNSSAGGYILWQPGSGGSPTTSVSGLQTGGAGGTFSVTGSQGGSPSAISVATITATGGQGSNVIITSGSGGNATGTAGTRNGGNSGLISIFTGLPGTGATANGTASPVYIGVNTATVVTVAATGVTVSQPIINTPNIYSTGTYNYLVANSTDGAYEKISNIPAAGVTFTVNTATDANYTISAAGTSNKLPTPTANRTVTLPAATTSGQKLEIWDQNSSGTFTWTFAGATVVSASSTAITTLVNQTWYLLESDGTNWIKQN